MKPGILSLGAALLAFLILYGITHPRQLVFADPPSRPYSGPYTRIVTTPREDRPAPSPTVAGGHTSQPTPNGHEPERASASGLLSGVASWYAYVPGGAAAGPALRRALGAHWRGMVVTVCASRCIRVTLSDYCVCDTAAPKLIDLDVRSFAVLAPLSRGVVRVEIGY